MAAIESLIIVHNVAKRHNVGTLVRSATAFGVSELILVGRRDFNTFGSHGSVHHLRFRHFYSLSDARLYLKVQTPPFIPFLSLSFFHRIPAFFPLVVSDVYFLFGFSAARKPLFIVSQSYLLCKESALTNSDISFVNLYSTFL